MADPPAIGPWARSERNEVRPQREYVMLSRPPKGTRKVAAVLTAHNFEWPPRRGRPDLSAERRLWVIDMAMLVWPARGNQRPLAPGPASEAVAERVWNATPRRERPWASAESLARMLRRDFKRAKRSLERMMRREREIQRILDREAEIEREIQRLVALAGEIGRARNSDGERSAQTRRMFQKSEGPGTRSARSRRSAVFE